MEIHVNGVRLFYEVTGHGRPLVLVHGNGENHHIFDEAIELLSQHFTCYAVDSRDHGQSSTVPALHYRDMAEDMTAFLKALNLQDVVFYGFSDGGIVGLMTALATERISTLIISGANLYPHGMTDEVYNAIEEDYLATGSSKALMMLKEPDITPEQLHWITVPTLVLAGSDDLIKEEHTREIAHEIPNSQLKILPNERHETYIIHSTKIAHEILCYTQSLSCQSAKGTEGLPAEFRLCNHGKARASLL